MRMIDIIEKKRGGGILTKEEITFFVNGYTNGDIPDYQASALLMTIFYEDMTDDEITALTLAMANSGDSIDLSSIHGRKVDKHSTGGVGDTTTLVLAPLVASVGVPVAKMSGRGLGHTGGTIDKLEAIPGFQVELSTQQFINQVNESQVAVIGQSSNLAPADKKLYALRDVTATVDSIPLIASSIMSKKIAAGTDAIVLDVTTGEGAFMKDLPMATRLAETMVKIGELAGRSTMAVISDMSQPLGEAIGNALEIREAIETLKGQGPADLMEMVLALGSQMVVLGGQAPDLASAENLLKEALSSGKALQKFAELIKNQGGDVAVIDQPDLMGVAQNIVALPAKKSGYVRRIQAESVGVAAMLLGAGRRTKDDSIDYTVGVKLHKKVGMPVQAGEPLVTVYANQADITEVSERLYQAIEIGEPVAEPRLIQKIVTAK